MTDIKVDIIHDEQSIFKPDELPDLGQFAHLFEGVTLPPKGTEERANLEKKLKRKLDFTIFPLLILTYILNYLDRNSLAASKEGTIMKDLNLTNTQFSTCQAILFVGYISMQIPSNIIMEKLGKPQYYLSTVMIIWGIISASMAAATNFRQLVAIRAILGAFEAAFYPGVMFYLSSWYTRTELAKRMSIFYTGSLLSGAFGGLIAYAVIENLEGVHGLHSWQYLFIIEGVATVGVAIICLFCLPELPATTRWLTKEERLLGVVRLIDDIGQADDDYGDSNTKKSAWQGLRLALTDVKVYLFLAILFFAAATASLNAVFPAIVASLGYGPSKTLLLTAPPWLLVAITSVVVAWHSDKKNERYWHVMIGPAISMVAFIIGIATIKTAPRYVAMMLLLQVYNSYGLSYAWASSNIPRPPIKRAAAFAIINIGGNLPNVYAPYLFSSNYSPHFYAGFGYCLASAILAMVFMTLAKWRLTKLNQKLERGGTVDGLGPETGFRFTL